MSSPNQLGVSESSRRGSEKTSNACATEIGNTNRCSTLTGAPRADDGEGLVVGLGSLIAVLRSHAQDVPECLLERRMPELEAGGEELLGQRPNG